MSGQADSAGGAMDRRLCRSWAVTEWELKMSGGNSMFVYGVAVSSVAIWTGLERAAE